ncbi:MAG: diphosphomevalonate decarboxylase [Bacteroidota bacterium]
MLDYKNPKLLIDRAKVEADKVAWRSPSNLALIKYWGKHGVQLPRNPSISITLENAFTETLVEYAPKSTTSMDEEIALEFLFAGEPNEEFGNKVQQFLKSITPIFPFLKQLELKIHSDNSFPHSSGIASSASSMSALALCLCTLEDNLFGTLSEDDAFVQKASYIARLGSGSACRSIFSPMAIWGQTSGIESSSDEYAIPFEQTHEAFKGFHDDILIVSSGEKSVSSRAGHALMEDNAYAEPRYQQARHRMQRLLEALKDGDLNTFGQIAENEALTLHALMMTSHPSYILMQPNSLEIINKIRAFRADTNHPVFFSLDAGPNVHLLYPENIIHEVRPFVDQELAPLCEEGTYLPDWIGEGPEEL